MDNFTLKKAVKFAEGLPHSNVDLENRKIQLVMPKGVFEEDLEGPGGLGEWFKENGFNVSYEVRDVEYTTQGEWLNYRGFVRRKGHTAYLRNRTVITATW